MQNESKFFQMTIVGIVIHGIVSEDYKLNVFSSHEEGYPHKSITHSLRCSVHGIPRAITMIVPGYQLRL